MGIVRAGLCGSDGRVRGASVPRGGAFCALPARVLRALTIAGPVPLSAADIPATAKNSLCGQSLEVPTTLTGQNGAVIAQTTKIGVSGCSKVKKRSLTRAQKLANALKACRKQGRSRRAACERVARKRYGPIKRTKQNKKK